MNTLEEILEKYEVVIGLEVHAQLKSESKIYISALQEMYTRINSTYISLIKDALIKIESEAESHYRGDWHKPKYGGYRCKRTGRSRI